MTTSDVGRRVIRGRASSTLTATLPLPDPIEEQKHHFRLRPAGVILREL